MISKLYLFDFDGTLTHKDSMFEFLKFHFKRKYLFSLIIYFPLFVMAKLGVLSKSTVKSKYLSFFLKGKSKNELEQMGMDFFKEKHQEILRINAIDYLSKIEGDKYLVSASLDFWLKSFANYLEMKLICTNAEYKNELFTGKFLGSNNNYEEKKKNVKKIINLKDYKEIYAFGDSKGDQSLYTLADKSYHKFFH